jgi:hypothetical protein
MHEPNIERCEPAEASPARRQAWVVGWFAILIVITVGVRVADRTAWLGSDDAGYYSAAEFLLAGKTLERAHTQTARMAVIVPVALSVRLFGDHPTAVALPMIAASIGGVVLVVLLGRLLWGWWEGLCAATVVPLLPYYRVLSTTAYADVHLCFWSTLAVLLAVVATRRANRGSGLLLGFFCGLSIGLATSAKVFGVLTVIPAAMIGWSRAGRSRGARGEWLASVLAGGLAFFLCEGLFYLWAGGDFWFTYHVHRNLQINDHLFPPVGYYQAGTFTELAATRLRMLFHPLRSGWGRTAVLFWPAGIAVLFLNRRGRPLAVWAMATYLLIALAPVNIRNGPHPYPEFDGRNALMSCIPFALCLAWAARRSAEALIRPQWVQRSWPIVVAVVAAFSPTSHGTPNGFRDRPTWRVGAAIERLIASTSWEENRDIYMTPSMYLRYRILFPYSLRARLRVATDEDAPQWWRLKGVDVVERWSPLPPPGRAYLIATPSQMSGQPEFWDYGVGLPEDELDGWRDLGPCVSIGRLADRSFGRVGWPADGNDTLVLLFGGDFRPEANAAHTQTHD